MPPQVAKKDAIITVGEGRGFLMKMNHSRARAVVTAAHCLPHLPRPMPADSPTYRRILSPLGEEPAVTAQCLFVDPVADVAVLCEPDGYTDGCAYERLVEGRPTLQLAAITRRAPAWLLALDGRWEESLVDVDGDGRSLTLIGAHIAGGLSGSPILSHAGRAVGIVSLGGDDDLEEFGSLGQPSLVNTLPGWLLAELLKSLKELPTVITAQRRAWRQVLRRPFTAIRHDADATVHATTRPVPKKGK